VDQITRTLLTVTSARWRLSGALDSGGTAEDGENQTRRADGGGKWVMEGEIIMASDQQIRLYEALLLGWSLGDTRCVVSRIGGPLMISSATDGQVTLVPFSDGSTFSDGTMFQSGSAGSGVLVDAADRGDVNYRLRVEGANRMLEGGEPFTLIGSTYLERLYGVARITNIQADGAAIIYTVLAAPPLRDPYPAGLVVDFGNPRCFMRADIDSSEAWPTYQDVFVGARIPVSFTETRRMA
jgi:hypothetical protein